MAPSETHHIAAEGVHLDITKVLHRDAQLSKRDAQSKANSLVNHHLEGVGSESIAYEPKEEDHN